MNYPCIRRKIIRVDTCSRMDTFGQQRTTLSVDLHTLKNSVASSERHFAFSGSARYFGQDTSGSSLRFLGVGAWNMLLLPAEDKEVRVRRVYFVVGLERKG